MTKTGGGCHEFLKCFLKSSQWASWIEHGKPELFSAVATYSFGTRSYLDADFGADTAATFAWSSSPSAASRFTWDLL
jgi:hypothetical protein